jgi:hypothetical protein
MMFISTNVFEIATARDHKDGKESCLKGRSYILLRNDISTT